MPHFRKKPVVIEAYQLPSPGDLNATSTVPTWIAQAISAGVIRTHLDGHVEIDTLEGTHRGDVSDWIIRGVKGELYPCKAGIFALTYEPVHSSAGFAQNGEG